MSRYEEVKELLRGSPRTWLVTGAAGFIGSNLTEVLLELGQKVVGLDNFATGHRHNIDDVLESVGVAAASNFAFLEDDIRDLEACRHACKDVDYVLHQAALGSVPRSLADPIATNEANIVGFLNMLIAARDAEVQRLVYAASSSSYGDHEALPKVENKIGNPLSPYAVTKYVNELYADVFNRAYGLSCVGLRYFNVFGRRQDPEGSYAAVIPKWVGNMVRGEGCYINGDGETSRDFCYIDNALQANLLASVLPDEDEKHEVYNVACGTRTTLNELFLLIRENVAENREDAASIEPEYREFRPGDVRHSLADIRKIQRRFGYEPSHHVEDGLKDCVAWYVEHLASTEKAGERA